MNRRDGYFAPPQRLPADCVDADYQLLTGFPLIQQLLDSFPEPVVILNWRRHIVLANQKVCDLLE